MRAWVSAATLVASVLASVTCGCTRSSTGPQLADNASASPEPPASASSSAAASETSDARYGADLLAITRNYSAMSRADGTWWAPEDCRAPIHPAFVSKAASGGHGRKIYALFVKDFAPYAALSGQHPPVQPLRKMPEVAAFSQVIVKEAWTPSEVGSNGSRETCDPMTFLAQVTMDGKAYRACRPAGLFVMYRPTSSEGTDDGWIYGTVQWDADPSAGPKPRVTSAGRVASCMGCHTHAPHGRLFGMAAK